MSSVLNKADKNAKRLQRHKRVRRKISGTTQRPRLCVFRSANNIYAQIIDDTNRVTLVAASSLDAEVKGAVNHTGNKEAAKKVGEMVAKKAVEKGITDVIFDRGGYLYHGRIKELAEAAREAGLKF
nr:50S ribosomal protein L18 [Romboutsia maritimum]